MGFSLYNMGFAAGIVGTIVVAMYKAFGYVPDPVFIWTNRANRFLGIFLGLVFASMVVVGWVFDRNALERLPIILKTSGRSPTDFIAHAGFGATLGNMGLAGAIGVAYVLVTGGDINGPSIGAILTIVGFAAIGKRPRDIAPVMIGVFIGAWRVRPPR